MGGGVCQALAVVLAMDAQQPGRDVPHHGGGGRHSVDPAGSLAVGADLAVKQQVLGGLVAAGFQLGTDRCRDLFKGGPDTGFVCTAAHKFPGGAVAEDRVDGINEDRLAGAGFAGQHVKAGGKANPGLFDHRHIFDFQLCQHAAFLPCSSNLAQPLRPVYCCSWRQISAAASSERMRIKNVSSPDRVPTTFSQGLASNTSQAALAMPEKHLTRTMCPA